MIIVNNEIITLQYYATSNKTLLKHSIVTDEDVNGNVYKKKITYMENSYTGSLKLLEVMGTENIHVKRLILYIVKHLRYGTNVITLINVDVAKELKEHPTNVSKALKRLKELKVIERVCDVDIYKDIPFSKKLYIVNHEYIFKGNLKHLERDFNKQLKYGSKN